MVTAFLGWIEEMFRRSLMWIMVLPLLCAGCTETRLDWGTSVEPVANDYCPEIVELVDEFNAIAFDGYLNDDTDTMDNMAFSSKKMSGLVKRAESEGVDLADPEVSWLKNLGLSADSFVILAQAAPNTFSDEELRGYLERIIGWYDVAGGECRVIVA